MTEVSFHTGLPDKQAYACRLLRKAWRQGLRVMVTGDAASLTRLDQALWLFEQEEFVPHLRLAQGAALPLHSARTPVWLAEATWPQAQASVLVNLGPHVAADQAQYPRIVELVSADADDALAGRSRWRQYAAAGLTPTNVAYTAQAD